MAILSFVCYHFLVFKMSSAFLHLLQYHGNKHYELWSDCSLWATPAWSRSIMFQIYFFLLCYLRTKKDERAGNKIHDWWKKAQINTCISDILQRICGYFSYIRSSKVCGYRYIYKSSHNNRIYRQKYMPQKCHLNGHLHNGFPHIEWLNRANKITISTLWRLRTPKWVLLQTVKV